MNLNKTPTQNSNGQEKMEKEYENMKIMPLTFGVILSSYKKFMLPLFQRKYCWDKKRWRVLLKDIRSSPNHFCGRTYIGESEEDKKIAIVLDGQQRFTTLFLLLLAIRKRIKKELKKQEKHKEANFALNLCTNTVSIIDKILFHKPHKFESFLAKEKKFLKLKEDKEKDLRFMRFIPTLEDRYFYNCTFFESENQGNGDNQFKYLTNQEKKDSKLYLCYKYYIEDLENRENIEEICSYVKKIKDLKFMFIFVPKKSFVYGHRNAKTDTRANSIKTTQEMYNQIVRMSNPILFNPHPGVKQSQYDMIRSFLFCKCQEFGIDQMKLEKDFFSGFEKTFKRNKMKMDEFLLDFIEYEESKKYGFVQRDPLAAIPRLKEKMGGRAYNLLDNYSLFFSMKIKTKEEFLEHIAYLKKASVEGLPKFERIEHNPFSNSSYYRNLFNQSKYQKKAP